MQDFSGRTAFVTGGASGIGLAMARAFQSQGANVMLADIEAESLDRAKADLRGKSADVEALLCDVSDPEAVKAAARQTIERFGNVHILCNNAGVGTGGPMEQVTAESWQWILGVNLMGVVHGLQAFVPHMKEHGEASHIVNTSSMAGMINIPHMGPYNATKFAVVALSETLAVELTDSHIGVSVLCPLWVRTQIHESDRDRPAELANPQTPHADPARRLEVAQLIESGMDPDRVADLVVAGIRAGRLHIFTHPETKAMVEARFNNILAAFDGLSG